MMHPSRGSAAGPVPLLVVAATDPVAREAAVAGLLLDLPGAAALVYEHRWREGPRPRLEVVRRVVETAGEAYRDEVGEGGDCACCSVRDDVVSALRTLLDQQRWTHLLVVPPLGAPVEELARQLVDATGDRLTGARAASVVAVVDAVGVREDLLGDALLDDRGTALSRNDRRSVGQAVAAQVEYADVVVGCHGLDAAASSLLRRLVGARWRADWSAVAADELVGATHDASRAVRRTDPLTARPLAPVEPSAGVWTLDLRASRPLHPGRLMERIEALGTGRVRARGVLWLPSRPQHPVVWDGSGGQLSIGLLEGWRGGRPATRLLVTGDDEDERDRIAAAFDAALMGRDDLRHLGRWSRSADGFEPWLGAVGTVGAA